MSGRDCTDRYNKKASVLKTKLARENDDPRTPRIPNSNKEEDDYKNDNYVASFSKTMNHNSVTGHLEEKKDFEDLVDSLINLDQVKLNGVPLHPNSVLKFANPLASKATPLIGIAPIDMKQWIPVPPALSSKQTAAEMIELYAKVLARDVPFAEFGTSPIIQNMVNHMNHPQVREHLKGILAGPLTPFTTKTIFRGNFWGEKNGPLLSQFYLRDITASSMTVPQKYNVPKSRDSAGSRVEWGVDNQETISIQNGDLPSLPPKTDPSDIQAKYVFSGRSLAESVHSDPPFHFYYFAALILLSKKCPSNVEFPKYDNQGDFITNGGPAALLTSLTGVCKWALFAAWHFKWCWFRRLRPEVAGLWINNVKNGIVSNNVYKIDDLVLDHAILDDIKNMHQTIYGKTDSYTLAQCFQEGSPTHPAYPAGHAVIAGACATILKIYFDCEIPWGTMFDDVIEANSTGDALQTYTEDDANNITITGEINKLASNVALGRDWAGVHYRTDGHNGILLGEQVAIHYMKDILASSVENHLDGTVPEIVFRKFDGTYETVRPTTCN